MKRERICLRIDLIKNLGNVSNMSNRNDKVILCYAITDWISTTIKDYHYIINIKKSNVVFNIIEL